MMLRRFARVAGHGCEEAILFSIVAIVTSCTKGDTPRTEISWRTAEFGDVCALGREVQVPIGAGRIKPLAGGRFLSVDQKTAVIREYDSLGAIQFESGRLGEGPGEFGFPTDVAAFGDSGLIVTDPARMRASILASSGKYLTSFATTGFAGKRVIADRRGQVVMTGLNRVDGEFRLAASFDTLGRLLWSAVPAPRLLLGIVPRVDESILVPLGDSAFVISSAALPTVWVIGQNGSQIAEIPLSLPGGTWMQRDTGAVHTPEDMRRLREHASLLTAAGLDERGWLELGWRTGQSTPKFYMAVVDLARRSGVVLRDAPNAFVAFRPGEAWLAESRDSADVLRIHTCDQTKLAGGGTHAGE